MCSMNSNLPKNELKTHCYSIKFLIVLKEYPSPGLKTLILQAPPHFKRMSPMQTPLHSDESTINHSGGGVFPQKYPLLSATPA